MTFDFVVRVRLFCASRPYAADDSRNRRLRVALLTMLLSSYNGTFNPIPAAVPPNMILSPPIRASTQAAAVVVVHTAPDVDELHPCALYRPIAAPALS
jgi:hypothetical protein